MRIVVAPGAFKGTMTAAAATARIGDMLRAEFPDAELVPVPMADGGDGTVDVLLAQGWTPMRLPAADALGRPSSTIAAAQNGIVAIELARTCGMHTIDAPAPRDATSLGLGIAMRAAVDLGARSLLVGLGGSASTDGGLGLLLGLQGATSGGGLEALSAVVAEGASPPADALPIPVTVLRDVASPLIGPTGAAVLFGPQKGLSDDDCRRADDVLARWAMQLGIDPTTPGAGAAGGCGAALLAAGAVLLPGGEEVADAVGLPGLIAAADLVVTGEGRLDASSLAGKAPAAVARLAAASGVPCRIVAGSGEAGVAAALGAELVLLPAGRQTP